MSDERDESIEQTALRLMQSAADPAQKRSAARLVLLGLVRLEQELGAGDLRGSLCAMPDQRDPSDRDEVRVFTAESVCDHCGKPSPFHVLCDECEELCCNECGRVECVCERSDEAS